MKANPSCASCDHFRRKPGPVSAGQDAMGLCTIGPPMFDVDGAGSVWPPVSESDGCGQHSANARKILLHDMTAAALVGILSSKSAYWEVRDHGIDHIAQKAINIAAGTVLNLDGIDAAD